jgi:hypothetical protein
VNTDTPSSRDHEGVSRPCRSAAGQPGTGGHLGSPWPQHQPVAPFHGPELIRYHQVFPSATRNPDTLQETSRSS